MTAAAIDPALRARLHARFPKSPRWAPPAPAAPSPWLVIREVLDRTQADGLSTLQQAGAVYTALVHHGLMDGGRA